MPIIIRKRDRAILDHILRYRLTTNAVLHRTLFPEQSINAVTKVTARLCQRGLLRRYPLVPPETYFTAGPEAVRQLGVPSRRTEPLGPQALPIDYAVLIYATQGKQACRRMTSDELATYMPWLPDELTRTPYCVGESGRLDLVRVDLGGSPQHVARKTAADVSARLSIPELAELAVCGRFQIVILTTTDDKARLISAAFEALGWSDQVRIHLAAVSRLSFLQLRGH